MATKITNVYVKNRAAGETSFTEVDSVYTGGTQVFKKNQWSITNTPMGIIPLKYVSDTYGSYGLCRSLFTQEEMDSDRNSWYGFLITPVKHKGSLYVPQVSNGRINFIYTIKMSNGWDNTSGSYLYAESNNHESPVFGTYSIWKKDIPKEGGAIFSSSITDTLHQIYYNDFSPDRSEWQYCYLVNLFKGRVFKDVAWVQIPYVWGIGEHYEPGTINVVSKSSMQGYVGSLRFGMNCGIKLSGSSNLYVN